MDPTQQLQESESSVEQAMPDGSKPQATRRQPCPCGSGKKFKNCCLGNPAYELVDQPPVAAAPLAPPTGKGGPGPKHFPKQNMKAFQSTRQSNNVHHRRVWVCVEC